MKAYALESVNTENTAFLSFFCAKHGFESKVACDTLKHIFQILPRINSIGYFLDPLIESFVPFTAPYQSKSTSHLMPPVKCLNAEVANNLILTTRKHFIPPFIVREARIEDCDDLFPIFKRHGLLEGKDQDNYLVELVRSIPGSSLGIVAESDGCVIGFMGVSLDIDLAKLIEMYELGNYNNLMGASGTPNTLCITLLCIEPQFAAFSSRMVQFAFEHFSETTYCVLSHAHNSPEIRICQDMIRIETKLGNTNA